MSSSSRSSQNVTQLSEKCSFSVDDISDETRKKIKIFYEAPKDQSLMIVTFPLWPAPPLAEQSMIYSEEDKGWFIEMDKTANAQEKFIIIPHVTPDSPLEVKQSKVPLVEGFIALKNGNPQPVNKALGVPQGKLETFLYTKQGEIKERIPESKLGEGDRLITIYFPPGYDPNRETKYNLQISLDGDPVSMNEMGTTAILDNLIAAKKIEPVVTVFVPPWNGSPDFEKYPKGEQAPPGYSENMRYTQYGCNQTVAEDFAITLPNAVRKNFNVTEKRENTAITGCSLGGLQAMFTALSYPTFGKVIAQSPALWWSPPDKNRIFAGAQWLKEQINNGVYDKNPSFKIWLEAGSEENGIEPYIEKQNFPIRKYTNEIAEILKNKGFEVSNSTIPDGRHSTYQWRCTMVEAETAMHARKPRFLELQAAYQHQENKTTANTSTSKSADLALDLPYSDFQSAQIIRPAISDSITVPATLQNGGTVTINIFPDNNLEIKDARNAMLVEIIYTPEKIKPEKGPLFLSYRNDATMGNIVKMEQLKNGNWRATRKMFPDESNEFGLHRVDPMKLNGPPDFNSPDHFQSQISLVNGKIVSETYPNPALTKERKTGTLERRIYKNDGTFSQPLSQNEKPHLQPDEEIVHIYLPPEYKSETENGHIFPVTVMLDGDMHVSTDPYGNSLHTPDMLDNLIAEKKIEPSVVIFTAPTPPMPDGTPRLREYGCDENTASRLSGLPYAAKLAGLSVAENNACILGASMGGIQAIYTAKMHPNVFDKVIAQSPALWWEPPAQLSGDKYHVQYDNDATWRNNFTEKFQVNFDSLTPDEKVIKDEVHYKGFIYNLLATGMDSRTGKKLPQGNVEITLQVGCNETGTVHPVVGKEPLTQATKTLARDFNIPLKIFDGGHSPGNWATGLCVALQNVYLRLENSRRQTHG